MELIINGICFISIAILQVCSATLPLSKHSTATKCYGDYDPRYTVLSLNCPENTVIGIGRILVGAKEKSSDCPESFDANRHNPSCCERSENDCIFDFDTSSNHRYHLRCSGQRSCGIQAQNRLTALSCSGAIEYLYSTSYMYVEYFCIPETKINPFCLAEDSADDILYLWNSKFPGVITDEQGDGCGCSVEIDNCEADINVYSIQRNLTKEIFKYGEKEDCVPEQSLTLRDSKSNLVYNWTCHDNSLGIKIFSVTSTYLTVNLDVTGEVNGGNFWFAFQASRLGNMTLHCPSRPQKFCLDLETGPSTPSDFKTITPATTPEPSDATLPKTSGSTLNPTPMPKASTNTSSPTTPNDAFNQWFVIGVSAGGAIFFTIAIVVTISICRRRRPGNDKGIHEPRHRPQHAFFAHNDPGYVVPNPRVNNNRINIDDDAISSVYFTPINDSDYASIGSNEAHRRNEAAAPNRDRARSTDMQRIQPCHVRAPLRNETF